MLVAKAPNAGEVGLAFSEAQAFNRQGNIEGAKKKLDDVEDALNGATATATATPSSAGDPKALFNDRLKELLPRIKAAAGTTAGDEAKLKASEASVFARKQEFVQANALLDQARAALSPSQSAATDSDWETLEDGPLKAAAVALTAKAARLATVPRPTSPPKQQATSRLLNGIAQKPAPENLTDAPAHVAGLLPNFLVSLEAERPATSQKLEVGAPLPASDQILGIADLFAAVQLSMIEWENLLGQAEAADGHADLLEDQAEERDESEYVDTLTAYNTRRRESLLAQERATRLMAELQTKFNNLSESQQAAALK